MDIVNYISFIIIADLDALADLVDHSAAPAGHFVDLFDRLVGLFDRPGCNSGLVDDYIVLAVGNFVVVVDNSAVLIDLTDLPAGHSGFPDYEIVLVDPLADPPDLVDHFANLCFANSSNDLARAEMAGAVADVFAVLVGPVVLAVDGMADLKGFILGGE